MSKLYVNIDIGTLTGPFLKTVSEQKNVCKEMLYPMVDQYRGTMVTDLLFNIFCQYSSAKSEVFEDYNFKINKKCENGISVDYSDVDVMVSALHKLDKKLGFDVYKIWIDRARENGINPWISFRMNDCHCTDAETSFYREEYFYEALKKGEMIGKEYGYYEKCYNFRYETYPKMLLEYIKEQLAVYDVYGVEFDFMRDITCFRYLHDDMDECRNIMNEYIRSLKAAVSDAEKIHGHKIKILIRVTRDIKQSYDMGFDVAYWVANDLVDVIVPTSRFVSSDSGINVDEWKKTGAEITVGMEVSIDATWNKPFRLMNPETARGQAASYLAAGSEGIYLYNYFSHPDHFSQSDHYFHGYHRNRAVYTTCGSLEKLYEYPLRFVVIPQLDDFSETIKAWNPFEGKGDFEFEIITGKLPEGKKAYVVIGYAEGDGEVFVNGEKCTELMDINMGYIPGIGMQPANYVEENTRCVRYKIKTLADHVQKIKVKSSDALVCWAEIYVI